MSEELDPPTEGSSQTQEIDLSSESIGTPLPDGWMARAPRFIKREVVADADGTWLIVRSLESRRIKVGKRKRRQERIVTDKVKLEDTALVQQELATKVKFNPAPGETAIRCLTRFSWWSRGPAQIAVILTALAGTVTLAYLGGSAWTSQTADWLLVLAGILLWIGCGIAYYVIWMGWAYRSLIITNRRIGLVYAPPFSLPGSENFAPLANIQVSEARDQSWAANLLERINPRYRFGVIANDTPAQGDEWLREIRFVREHLAVNELLMDLIIGNEEAHRPPLDDDTRDLQRRAYQRFLEIHGDPT